MLNIRFIIKMLGMMFILETLFMLAATAVAFLYEGNDFYPLLQSVVSCSESSPFYADRTTSQ